MKTKSFVSARLVAAGNVRLGSVYVRHATCAFVHGASFPRACMHAIVMHRCQSSVCFLLRFLHFCVLELPTRQAPTASVTSICFTNQTSPPHPIANAVKYSRNRLPFLAGLCLPFVCPNLERQQAKHAYRPYVNMHARGGLVNVLVRHACTRTFRCFLSSQSCRASNSVCLRY